MSVRSGAAEGAVLQSLLDQRRYRALERVVSELGEESLRCDAAAWVVVLRSLLERGLVGAAAAMVQRAKGCFASSSPAGLWMRYPPLLARAPEAKPGLAAQLLADAQAVAAAPKSSPHDRAGAAEFACLVSAVLFSLEGGRPERREESLRHAATAVRLCREVGAPRSAERVQRRAFRLLRLAPADPGGATEWLGRARETAQARGDLWSVAESDLLQAEADLEEILEANAFGSAPPPPESWGARVRALEAVADRIREGGGVMARARARWTAADLLLRYGVPAGEGMARAAVRGFREGGDIGSELSVHQTLSSWHLVRGDAARAERHLVRAQALSEQSGMWAAESARQAAFLEDLTRRGHFGQTELHTSPQSGSMQESVAQAVQRSAALSLMGLTEEAAATLREVQDGPASTGHPSPLAADVALSLGTHLADSGPGEAVSVLLQGAAQAHRQGLRSEEAQCLATAAWVAAVAAGRGVPVSSPAEIEERFAAAERLLGQTPPDLAAHVQLVKLCHLRHQEAFIRRDWDGCGRYLTLAEAVCRGYGLGLLLADTLSFEALTLMEVNRMGADAYEQTNALLAEASELRRRAGYAGEAWRGSFHRAVNALESGDRHPDQEVRRERWMASARLLDAAAVAIDRLRSKAAVADTAPERAQAARMAAVRGKEEVYRLGFELQQYRLGDSSAALWWLERAKARALLDGVEALGESDEGRISRIPLPGPVTVARLRIALKAEEQRADGRRVLLVQYRCVPAGTLVYGLRSDWDEPRMAAVPLSYEALAESARMWFQVPGGVRMMMEDYEGDVSDWYRLAPLVSPLAEWSAPGDLVHLVPYGLLHQLPLHTLPVDGVPLLLRNPVCYAPSAAILHGLWQRPRRAGEARRGRAAVFGDPRQNLPRAVHEARVVADLLGVKAELGANVSLARVREALREDGLVHLAAHGVLSVGDGFERGMDLADGRLRASALLGGQTAACGTVVLSGCETGVNEQRPGDEPVGLTRALLLGGSSCVVVSQWQVADDSAAELLTAFHEELGAGAPLALHRAALRSAGGPDPQRHLYHWGAFVVVGDWT
ncbi:CHAT domain-containing protein [Kitasatospora sp. NPDC001683]